LIGSETRSSSVIAVALAFASALAGAPETARNAPPIHITAPDNGSVSRSGYLGMDGTAPPATRLEVLDGETLITTLASEEDGHFDAVLRLKPGERKLRIRVSGDPGSASAPVSVRVSDSHDSPLVEGLYENLREGDILLSRDLTSLQVSIYNPRYTHAGIYLGPDPDGTPVVLEPAVNEVSESYGVIAAVPIEESLAFARVETGLYRLKSGFRSGERDRLLAWGRTVAKREVPFWLATRDFGTLYRTWLMWDFEKDRPRNPAEFAAQIAALQARMNETARFDCVTLVWQAYRDATGGRVNLGTPNYAKFEGVGRSITPRFLARVRPVLIVPDTFAMNGKLALVAGR
jgi:hypothetical protein